MKLLLLIGTLVLAENRGRPSQIDVVKRLGELKRMAETCPAQLDKRPHAQKRDTVAKNITRKLKKMYDMAQKYCQFQHEDCRDAFGDIRPENIGIDETNPCKCVNGVTGGYKSFFNRAKQNGDSVKGVDHKMQRDHVVKLSTRIKDKLI